MNLPSAHSKVGASIAERFFICPGSVRECAKVPNPSSAYAEEGTKAHDLAALMLQRDGFNDGSYTDDMREAVSVYYTHVKSLLTPSDTLLVEHGFHLKQIHPDCYGTADAVIWKPYSRHLHVIDYKHGAGKAVEVTANKQLRYYALGALLSLNYNAREVTVTIVQPRCPHEDGVIRSETFDAFELLAFAADLKEAVLRTEAPDAPLVPGDHCRATFCPAAATCPALQSRALEVAQYEFSAAVPYDPVKLKLALDSRGAMKAWIKALDEFAYREALAGRLPPEVGYKLVAKRANREWKDPVSAELFLSTQGLQEDEYLEPRALKSPAQLEKALGKKQFTEIEKQFVEKKSSGHTLAPESDKRPAVRVLDAAAEFASVPVETEVSDE